MDLSSFEKISQGYHFTICCSPKRDEGEWWDRYTWTLIDGKRTWSSDWFGFTTLKEALEDLTSTIENDLAESSWAQDDEEEVELDPILKELFNAEIDPYSMF